MLTILLAAAIQGPPAATFTPIYHRKLNDTPTLVVSAAGSDIRQNVHLSQLSVGLLKEREPPASEDSGTSTRPRRSTVFPRSR